MKFLIISHERSVNKAEAFIRYLHDKCKVTLITEFPVYANKTFAKNVTNFVVDTLSADAILAMVSEADEILCLSENLLPIQAELEEHYKIKNLTHKAAKTLSNKQEFQRYCKSIGLSELSPTTSTPRSLKEILDFQNPLIVKPDIGTGSNNFYTGSLRGLEYQIFNSGDALVQELQSRGSVDEFLHLNNDGLSIPRFNNVPCRMMLQEFHPSQTPSFGPCGFVKNGRLTILFYVHNIKRYQRNSIEAFQDNTRLVRTENHHMEGSGDYAIYSSHVSEVERDIHNRISHFLSTVVKSLQIENLFFAGPDFHVIDNQLFAIDFNPRPGHFFNLIDVKNNHQLVSQYFKTQTRPINIKPVLWATVPLPYSIIENWQWLEKYQNVLALESESFDDGTLLPSDPYLQSKPRSLQVYFEGHSKKDLFEKYSVIRKNMLHDIETSNKKST